MQLASKIQNEQDLALSKPVTLSLDTDEENVLKDADEFHDARDS